MARSDRFVGVFRRSARDRCPNHRSAQNGRDRGFHETVDAQFATGTLANSSLFQPPFASLQRRYGLFAAAEISRNCATLGERVPERE